MKSGAYRNADDVRERVFGGQAGRGALSKEAAAYALATREAPSMPAPPVGRPFRPTKNGWRYFFAFFAFFAFFFFAALRAGFFAAALRTVDFFFFAVIGIETTPSKVR